jgi:hypothetical protein
VLKLGGAAAAAGLGFPAVLRAQQIEIPMLGLWSFTGAFSDRGPVLDRGMKLALDERGMKIQGKTIRYITRTMRPRRAAPRAAPRRPSTPTA